MPGGPEAVRIGATAWRVALCFSLAVILGIAVRELPIPILDDVNDKIRHAGAFFALALMADYAFPASRFGPAKFLPLMGYGALIELVQHFLPWREASGLDLVADAAGIAAYAATIPLHRHVAWLGRR